MPQRSHTSHERHWALPSLPMAHGPEPDIEGLLDLSFLTEEEQEAITDVLKRDARLRQLEEGRVSKLRASLADPGQLKTLTGDWFKEARSQRHHHAHFGSDLVRASIRRKKSSRGDQALGSDGEAEDAGKGASEEEPEPRVSIEMAVPERHSGTQGPDFPSPYVASTASGHEDEPQAGEDPGRRGVQVAETDTALDPEQRVEQESWPSAAQIQATSEIQENGEEAPGLGPSLDRMLSSSSSVSSLNSSTLSGSLMSLSGEAEAGTVQVRGSVHFTLRYEPGAAELRVQVIQCQGLAAARRRRSDPYVKTYLLPDKQNKRKTSVKKRNLNPIFNETLRHSVQQADLPGRVLNLSVWHRESLGRNVFLGEVEVPLDTWNWDSEATWLPLQPRVPPSPDDLPSRGFLSLSLKYVPAGSEAQCYLMTVEPAANAQEWFEEASALCSTTPWFMMALDLLTFAKPVLSSPCGTMGPWPVASWGAHASALVQAAAMASKCPGWIPHLRRSSCGRHFWSGHVSGWMAFCPSEPTWSPGHSPVKPLCTPTQSTAMAGVNKVCLQSYCLFSRG
ncbi:synaptotagmin-like protein 1 isoform X2 [Mesocricetus auratus]|uniref:Synaptotagmin-like protein 1 isoform X2 n=1 Tax=Mesocricetus auratus TaxID=10036 RepID=A0ABM2YC97_MESAU|nr:synaptotagmin-like protein 1 isoform X2 [Mesocricetus auratus]